jgi:diadenosine tetraphosphate (Ap4A) HIT family hydrolase
LIIETGAEAGQTVPHVHFHIIPRLGEVRNPGDITDAERKNIALGEGPRVKLGDEEGTELSGHIKAELVKETQKLKDAGEVEVGGEGDVLFANVVGRGLKL